MSETPPDWSEPLRRLGESVTGWLAGLPVGAERPAGTDHPSSCRGCPVCAVLAVLRGERPEVTDALADVLTSAAAALRSFTVPRDAPPEDAPPEEAPPEEAPSEQPKPPAVQRIDVA